MELTLIAAIAKNYVEDRGYPIGKDGKIPWRIPADLKRFRELTLNHPVIMGRKTYESIGKPLKDRLNIVISGEKKFDAYYPAVRFFNSIQVVMDYLDLYSSNSIFNLEKIYVVGGEKIYHETIELASTLEITHVNQIVENADAFFPKIGKEWKEVKRDNKQEYSFVTYEK